jgi:serine/threonine protein kinase
MNIEDEIDKMVRELPEERREEFLNRSSDATAADPLGGKEADRRADIWAFGVVLSELLTGERPFKGKDSTEIMARAVTSEPVLDQAPARVKRTKKVRPPRNFRISARASGAHPAPGRARRDPNHRRRW